MNVLHINVCAASGSTGKIVTSISRVLTQKGHKSIVCYGANETINKEGYYRFCSEQERVVNALTSRITGVMYGVFPMYSTHKLKEKIRKEKPDVVHLHCINGYIVDVFKLLDFLAEESIDTVLSLHAEFMFTGTCAHAFDCDKWRSNGCHDCIRNRFICKSIFDPTKYSWQRLKKSYSKFNNNKLIVTSVSPWLNNRAQESSLLFKFSKYTVLNGIDTSIFHYKDRTNLQDTPSKFCLHVTASFSEKEDDNKGGIFVIKLAKMNPDINFVVVANYADVGKNLPNNIKFFGKVDNQHMLADLYNKASVSLICSKRETFSMVTAESLCCGTPVVGFKAGGPESITIDEYSSFVSYGDVVSLSSKLRDWYFETSYNKIEISMKGVFKYSEENMTNSFLKIYESF